MDQCVGESTSSLVRIQITFFLTMPSPATNSNGFFKTTKRKKRARAHIPPMLSPASLVLNKRFITPLKLPKNLQVTVIVRDHSEQCPVCYLIENIGPVMEQSDWLILVIGHLNKLIPSMACTS